MLRKQRGGGGGRNILDKISNVVSPTTLKRDESSIRKLLIHIASIFLSQLTNIRQNFFFKLLLLLLQQITSRFYEHIPRTLAIVHISSRRADLTPGRQPRPVLSPFTTKPNNRPFTKQHLSIHLSTSKITFGPLKLIPR